MTVTNFERERRGGLGLWLSRIRLLIMDHIGGRFRRSRMSALLAIAEPLGVVAIVWFLQSYTDITRAAPFGTSVPLFYVTGVLPFYLFFHVSLRLRGWDSIQRRPRVSEFDLLLSICLAELVSKLVIIGLCLIAFYYFGSPDAFPVNPLVCLFALLCLTVLGASVGVLNAIIIAFLPLWSYTYQIGVRALMAFSGILLVVDYAPVKIRDAASWIPVTHGVILYRTGHYKDYPHFILDMNYLFWVMLLGSLLVWILEFATREWRPML